MEKRKACAILGHSPMRFAWGFDEEDYKCTELKIALMQQVMVLRQKGVTDFYVACDCGVGLYAAEGINALRATDEDMFLLCVRPHEGQATKWAPYLRDRYFAMLEKCTFLSDIALQKTENCQLKAYEKIIDYADIVLAVYDPASNRGDDVDAAMAYAAAQGKAIILLHPDTLAATLHDR